jgi:HEAT repeat protein
MLVAGCSRDEPMAGGKPLSHWKKEATQVSWTPFWSSFAADRRREAFHRLHEIGEPAVPALVELVQHDHYRVRGDALTTLTNLGPRAASAVPQLIGILNGNQPELRSGAARILGAIGPAARPAEPSLTPLLRDPDPQLRQAAADALAQIRG